MVYEWSEGQSIKNNIVENIVTTNVMLFLVYNTHSSAARIACWKCLSMVFLQLVAHDHTLT